jgi:hypothetical protein
MSCAVNFIRGTVNKLLVNAEDPASITTIGISRIRIASLRISAVDLVNVESVHMVKCGECHSFLPRGIVTDFIWKENLSSCSLDANER